MEKLHLNSLLYDFDAEYGGIIVGMDEAGRGCLAGDVFAAAVVLDPEKQIPGLDDSKKLSAVRRERLYREIVTHCKGCAIATASVAEVEELNILHASMLAMKRAHDKLLEILGEETPNAVLVDGNRLPQIEHPSAKTEMYAVVGGDAKSAAIAAASILAKVARDEYMRRLDRDYPEYEFARHKGYGTKLHYEKLVQHGISPVHRKSFLTKISGKK
ncbi:MAG: ribonuclease HII [Oscillospiraceae bacterium]|nr:ribonuclease HII [Oscillospiraceae bacterium]